MNLIKIVLIFTMLIGYFFEKSSYGTVLSFSVKSQIALNQSAAENHCSSHSNNCDSNDTECNVCHSFHSGYIATPLISVKFIEAVHTLLLKDPKSYYFTFSSILLRPPIS